MSATTYYECHITMIDSVPEIAVTNLGWKFSKIDGDPTLGIGIKSYATKHFNAKHDKSVILAELHKTADKLVARGYNVVRRKIELVIYDDRSSTVRFACNGLCPECK